MDKTQELDEKERNSKPELNGEFSNSEKKKPPRATKDVIEGNYLKPRSGNAILALKTNARSGERKKEAATVKRVRKIVFYLALNWPSNKY